MTPDRIGRPIFALNPFNQNVLARLGSLDFRSQIFCLIGGKVLIVPNSVFVVNQSKWQSRGKANLKCQCQFPLHISRKLKHFGIFFDRKGNTI